MIFVSAIFINNIILSQLLGVSLFIRSSREMPSALNLSFALIIIMPFSSLLSNLIYRDFLSIYQLEFLMVPSFIITIAAVVQLFELFIKKTSPSFKRILENIHPFLVVNCAVLGVALLSVQKELTPFQATCLGFANALGFMLSVTIFTSLHERLNNANIPPLLKGIPITLITLGLLSMAFMGFSGISN